MSQIMLLFKDVLEDNRISPQRLINALEVYLATLDQYVEVQEIRKREADLLLSKEMKEVIKPFLNLLSFVYLLSEKRKGG